MEQNHDDRRRDVLLAAGHQATIAAEAMMRAALEDAPVDDETMEKLADAVKLLAVAEHDLTSPSTGGDIVRLHDEATAYLNGDWR